MYQVEFAAGKVTESTANFIAVSMYAQCDGDGNECLFLDLLINYQKDNKVINKLVYDAEQKLINTLKIGKFDASGRMVLPNGKSCPRLIIPSKSNN